MGSWSDTFQSAFEDVVGAGADIIKQKAEAAGRTNNAPVTPAQSDLAKWQPLVYVAVAGIALVVILLVAKKR